jgi:cytochrome c oxidase assembly protein subunit 15
LRARNILLVVTVGLLFALIVVGAYVAADPEAGEACGSSASWPLCNGQLFPTLSAPIVAEYSHRVLALASALVLFAVTAVFWRGKDAPTVPRRALLLASAFMVFQIGLGDVVIGSDLEPALVALHQANAISIFAFVVAALAARNQAPLKGFNARAFG